MFPYRPSILAMAAAGLLAAEGVPEALSEDVFVPELAALEGALCSAGTLPAQRPGLLRLAQAARTEVGPAAPAAASARRSAAEEDVPLLPGLGKMSYRITTDSAIAHLYFEQGLRLSWAFNHAEALRAFRKAQRLDPECAMCYWGEAWALGPNINAPMEPDAIAPAHAAIEQARAHASDATLREQVLIEALAERYSADPKADRARLDAAYALAMKRATAQFPDDLDIAALYADALMNTSPWDYWQAGGAKLKDNVAELVATLERVLAHNPNHAGAIHLYIHAVEASSDPKRAEPYADRLAKLMRGAGHIVHMPSHIYYRIGRYKDALEANRTAVKVDEAYIARHKPQGLYPAGYYPHNVHFLMAAAQMGGDGRTAISAARKLAAVVPDELARAVPMLLPLKAAPYYAHAMFSDRATVLALPDPGADFPYVRAARHYARGVVLAQSGDAAGAGAELESIERIGASADFKALAEANIPGREVVLIAAHVLRARIAQAGHDLAAAVRELEAAIVLEDALPYMEPPYWYYPLRQTLGGVLAQRGEHQRARDAFRDSLRRAPNNGWALFGLARTYEREGLKAEAAEVERHLVRAWFGERKLLDLSRL